MWTWGRPFGGTGWDTPSSSSATAQRQGDALYFLSTDSPDATTSTLQQINLTRLDPYVQPLLTAEFEAILSTSPDVRHVLALMDDNGRLDLPYESEMCCSGRDHWLMTIISAEDGQIIYQSLPVAVFKADQIGWLDEQTLVFITTDSVIHRVNLA